MSTPSRKPGSKPTSLFSSGFAYSHLDNTFFGSRIYGSDFDVGYAPNAQYGFGYFNLGGSSRLNEYVDGPEPPLQTGALFHRHPFRAACKRMMWMRPPAALKPLAPASPWPLPPLATQAISMCAAALDLAYAGFTNWVLHARVDLTEVDGNLDQYGGLIPINGIGVPGVQSVIDERNFIQKYTAGARWYPSRRAHLDAGGYFKQDDYHYVSSLDSTPDNGPTRYPGYLEMQKFATYDANTRLTLRLSAEPEPHEPL